LQGETTLAAVSMHRCGVPDPARPAVLAQIVAFYAFPPLLWAALVAWLRWPARWLALGAATWLVCAPALAIVPPLVAFALGTGAWGAALALTAGICEECARWLAFRRFAPTGEGGRALALLAGAGHGGVESFVLGLQFAVFPLLTGGTATFLGAVLRPILVLGHMGLSALVWRAVRERRLGWLGLAIALHVGLDALAFAAAPRFPQVMFLVVLGALALAAFALREVRAAR
jgi:hypothetical protein